ncbi:MAG: response regulator [Bryobacterales bacterium]|nr:response regulator [Bryobacterales bacterium]
MSISAQLVSLMGGRISVESEPGSGSTFHVTVPFAIPEDQPVQPEPAMNALAGVRMLVVDDNTTNRRILAETLRCWQALPETSESGAEALRTIGKAVQDGTPFDLILTDACMPGMDGFLLIESIFREFRTNTPAIILLSSVDRGQAGPNLGISAYLMNPVQRHELFRAICQALRVQSQNGGRPSEDASSGGTDTPGGRKLRVLLAEDNPINQKLAVRLLEKHGHTVEVAATGREAVDGWTRGICDAILMDCQMPEMDGYAATHEIRVRERHLGRQHTHHRDDGACHEGRSRESVSTRGWTDIPRNPSKRKIY